MMEAVRTSETSVDNHFTRQYNPEDSSEHHIRRRENLKSHMRRLFRVETKTHFPLLRRQAAVARSTLSGTFCISHLYNLFLFYES
jgi:hypothetical protein